MEGWLSKVVDKGDVTDPYVDVRLGNAKIAKTRFDVVNSMFPCVCFKEVLLGAFDADDKFFEVFFRAPWGCFCSSAVVDSDPIALGVAPLLVLVVLLLLLSIVMLLLLSIVMLLLRVLLLLLLVAL